MKNEFKPITLDQFKNLSSEKQIKVYNKQLSKIKIDASTPAWIERVQTAIRCHNPLCLNIPQLAELLTFYWDYIAYKRRYL